MKRNFITSLVSVLLLSLLTLSPAWAATDPADYFPLKVGNSWSFEIDTYGQNMQMEYQVVGKQTIDNHSATVIESVVNGATSQTEYYETTPHGVFTIRRDVGSYQFQFPTPQTFLKYPVTVGASWNQKGKMTDPNQKITYDYTQNCKYLAMEDVTVPAGTFKAVKLQLTIDSSDGSHIEGFRYFSPNLGLLKEDLQLSINGVQIAILSQLTGFKQGLTDNNPTK